MIANNLIRAGFELTLENEADASMKHCEFAAVSKKTGKKYWIEAKMRAVAGLLGKTKLDGTTDSDPTGRLTDHVNDALKKPAQDERMIFVDVNADPSVPGVAPSWTNKAAKRMDAKEKDLQDGQTTYVFVTNMPFHRALESDAPGHMLMAFGLGMPDFGKEGHIRLSAMHRGRLKHADAYTVIEAFRKYPQIPPTFDGSLPSSLSGKPYDRIVIGETYHFTSIGENGLIGTVTAATVNEAEKEMIIAVATNGEGTHMLRQPMPDEALLDYQAHPETFFGVIQPVSKNIQDPYELFLFFLSNAQKMSKEKLLQDMKVAPDIAVLREMGHEDLTIEHADRMASDFILRHPLPKVG